LIELLITVAVLGILASAALPLAHVTAKRTREIELRRSLRTLRENTDRFKLEYDKARANAQDAKEIFKKKVTADRTGYPLTLEELVEAKVLRRIPKDPMSPDGKWITFVRRKEDRKQVFVVDREGKNERLMDEGSCMRWSADSRRLGYRDMVTGL
jgi:general secretion pathway protein G